MCKEFPIPPSTLLVLCFVFYVLFLLIFCNEYIHIVDGGTEILNSTVVINHNRCLPRLTRTFESSLHTYITDLKQLNTQMNYRHAQFI